MAVSATAGKKETQFLWEGKDKRGQTKFAASRLLQTKRRFARI